MKRAMLRAQIKDIWKYSLHNIRKTNGMWLKALDVKDGEIIKRLGHDYNTFYKHYGSADIFTDQDRKKIINIIGDGRGGD